MKKRISQDDRWKQNYAAFMEYMETNKRRPSKYYIEDRKLYNWFKNVKKLLAKGLLTEIREKQFKTLLEKAASVRRINQYSYLEREDE
jgi:hypothetical protein